MLGATLEADVARLRVLRAGATWRYTGVVRDAGAPASAYANVVTHQAAGNGVIESSTDVFAGGASAMAVRIEAGAVRFPMTLNDLGIARTVDFVELRAPVRVGDQITQVDERVADVFSDLDGDGKREAMDLAIWTRVVGEETVDLLHRPGLRAVRVDTSFAVRLVPSVVTAPVQPSFTSVQRNWYVAGVGLVRTELETPTGDPQGATNTVVEELESWDGLTEGLGALPPVIGRLPGDGAALGVPMGAVAFSDHAVMVVGGPYGSTGATAPVMARVNLQGEVTATYPINIADSTSSFGPGDLLRVDGGLRLITRVGGASPGVVMTSRNGDGQAVEQAPVRLIDALPSPPLQTEQPAIATASTANRVWLMWMRTAEGAAPDAVFSADLVVQGFTSEGTPLSAPHVLLAQVDSRDVWSFRLAANSTHVLATWAFANRAADHPYAVFGATSGAELARRTTTALPSDLVDSVPLATDGQLALTWRGKAAGAVWLDANFDAVQNTPGDWRGDLLPTTLPLAVDGPILSAQGDTCLLRGAQNYLREPLYGNTLTTLALMTLPAGPGPLSAVPLTIHARLPVSGDQPMLVAGVLLFDDRLLLYGHGSDYSLSTIPVWRRK